MTRQPSLDMSQVQTKLGRLRDRHPRVRRRFEDLAGNGLLSEAQENAPIKTGDLRDSSLLQRIGRRVVIGFTVSYAAVVHAVHPTKDRYLQRAIEEEGLRIIGGAVDVALREDGGLDR